MTDTLPHILIANPDPSARTLLGGVLTTAGYAVTTVADGTEALTRLADPLAFLDAAVLADRLPGLGGRDVLRVARSWGIDTAILLVTDDPDREEDSGEDPDDTARVVWGPLDPPTLARAVADLVGRCTGAC